MGCSVNNGSLNVARGHGGKGRHDFIGAVSVSKAAYHCTNRYARTCKDCSAMDNIGVVAEMRFIVKHDFLEIVLAHFSLAET